LSSGRRPTWGITLTHTARSHVTIVVLNWNGRDDTLDCLDSLQSLDYPNYSVIVVDNGSSDDSVAAIRKQYPGYELIETGKNLGYAGGNNVGIRRALELDADYILLLNNDTLVDTGMLREFVSAAAMHPEAGVFAGKIFQLEPPDVLWYAGARWLPDKGGFQHVGAGQRDVEAHCDEVVETDYASGCAFFAPAASFRKVGLLDEDMFLMFEESDWCYRAKEMGLPSLFIPSAKLWHRVSASFGGKTSPLATYFLTRNRLLWASRHLSLPGRLSVWRATLREYLQDGLPPFQSSGRGPRALYWATCSYFRELARRHELPLSRARREAVRDYIRGRFGDCPADIRQLSSTATRL
jgi:GT2 family glycosyltransferase